MFKYKTIVAATVFTVAPFAATSAAQAQDEGPYGVVRAGVAIDGDLKPRDQAPVILNDDIDFKPGFTGELGIGYKISNFRLEGTVGYTTAKIDSERSGGGFNPDDRVRSLNLGLSAYADIPVSDTIVPYIGGGVGASRVDVRLIRSLGTPATVARFYDKDWGFQWHLDAGVGIKAAERTTIELGARYTRTSSVRVDGFAGALPGEYRPRLSNVSAMIGIRQGF